LRRGVPRIAALEVSILFDLRRPLATVTICHQLYAYVDFALTPRLFRFTSDEN
jgi:hypothetical protein